MRPVTLSEGVEVDEREALVRHVQRSGCRASHGTQLQDVLQKGAVRTTQLSLLNEVVELGLQQTTELRATSALCCIYMQLKRKGLTRSYVRNIGKSLSLSSP